MIDIGVRNEPGTYRIKSNQLDIGFASRSLYANLWNTGCLSLFAMPHRIVAAHVHSPRIGKLRTTVVAAPTQERVTRDIPEANEVEIKRLQLHKLRFEVAQLHRSRRLSPWVVMTALASTIATLAFVHQRWALNDFELARAKLLVEKLQLEAERSALRAEIASLKQHQSLASSQHLDARSTHPATAEN